MAESACSGRANSSKRVVRTERPYEALLRGQLGKDIEIIAGRYDARPARAHMWVERMAAGKSPVVDIWKLEEKQSDVALALHAFCDAVLDCARAAGIHETLRDRVLCVILGLDFGGR
jgi:hypothetical protein